MTLFFWFSAIIAALLIIVPAVVAYIKEDRSQLKWWVSAIPISGAICGIIFNYHSQMDASRLQDTINTRDKVYKMSFKNSLDSAHKIIGTLDSSILTTKSALEKTTTVLDNQSKESNLLTKQLRDTRMVLGNTKENLKKADSIFYYVGGKTIPIIDGGVSGTGMPDLHYNLYLRIENNFEIPIHNIRYTFNSSLDKTETVKEIPSLTRRYGPLVITYPIPMNVDSVNFGGLVLWDSQDFRAYYYKIKVKKDMTGQFTSQISYEYAEGSLLFRPFLIRQFEASLLKGKQRKIK